MIRFASAPGGRRTARNGADGRREWHQDHRAPPRRSLMGEGCRQAERERGVDRGTKAGRGARMTQLRGRTPGPRARAPSDGRKSPGPPPRRRLRPAGHGAAAPRHRGAGRYQHASAHRAGYRDAVSVARRGGQVGRRAQGAAIRAPGRAGFGGFGPFRPRGQVAGGQYQGRSGRLGGRDWGGASGASSGYAPIAPAPTGSVRPRQGPGAIRAAAVPGQDQSAGPSARLGTACPLSGGENRGDKGGHAAAGDGRQARDRAGAAHD